MHVVGRERVADLHRPASEQASNRVRYQRHYSEIVRAACSRVKNDSRMGDPCGRQPRAARKNATRWLRPGISMYEAQPISIPSQLPASAGNALRSWIPSLFALPLALQQGVARVDQLGVRLIADRHQSRS